jgi:hypothetical protein
VLGYLTQLRKAQGLAPRTRTVQPGPPVTDPSVQGCTPRQATWLVLQPSDHVTAGEQALLDRLRQAHPACTPAIALAQGLAAAPPCPAAGAARGVAAAGDDEFAGRVSTLSAQLPARLCGGQSRRHSALE